jgi:hypothetical protein
MPEKRSQATLENLKTTRESDNKHSGDPEAIINSSMSQLTAAFSKTSHSPDSTIFTIPTNPLSRSKNYMERLFFAHSNLPKRAKIIQKTTSHHHPKSMISNDKLRKVSPTMRPLLSELELQIWIIRALIIVTPN